MADNYRLKRGTHIVGQGKTRRTYRHNDPENNIVESDEPLDEMMPEKFELYHGPARQKREAQKSGTRLTPKERDNLRKEEQSKLAKSKQRKEQVEEEELETTEDVEPARFHIDAFIDQV